MKHKNFPLILLVIVLIVALMACLYVSNSVPAFNSLADTVFEKAVNLIKGSENVDSEEKAVMAPVAETKPAASKKSTKKDVLELTERGYALASAGKYKWLYESEWPFVTEPVIHEGTVFTTTAEPAFMIFEHETGELIAKQDCPVYPGEQAVFDGTMLSLVGRDGKTYLFRLEDDFSLTDMRGEVPADEASETDEIVLNESVSSLLLKRFTPDKKAADFMANRIKEWVADEEVKPFPDVRIYTGHINQEGNGNYWAEECDGGETTVFVFSPDKQGVFQIGLADENGGWIKADAFVAVFGEAGDLKQVSIDYVANKPQIKLHLSETEIYYIVTGWARDKYDGTRTWLQIAESR